MPMTTSEDCPVCGQPITGWDIVGRPRLLPDQTMTKPVQVFMPCRCGVAPPMYPQKETAQ
jgi:hypothetical protein